MKNYREMADCVLRRRDQYVAARRTALRRTSAVLACLCLCAVTVVGLRLSGTRNRIPSIASPTVTHEHGGSAPVEDSRGTPQTQTGADEASATEAPTPTLTVNEVAAHELAHSFTSAALFNLPADRFHALSRTEMLDYLGVSLDLSAGFPDFAEAPTATYGYYTLADGSVWDQQAFNYADPAGRTITVTLRRNALPLPCATPDFAAQAAKSTLNGYPVLVLHATANGSSIHYAELMPAQTGITVFADGLSTPDFTRLLTTLIP